MFSLRLSIVIAPSLQKDESLGELLRARLFHALLLEPLPHLLSPSAHFPLAPEAAFFRPPFRRAGEH